MSFFVFLDSLFFFFVLKIMRARFAAAYSPAIFLNDPAPVGSAIQSASSTTRTRLLAAQGVLFCVPLVATGFRTPVAKSAAIMKLRQDRAQSGAESLA